MDIPPIIPPDNPNEFSKLNPQGHTPMAPPPPEPPPNFQPTIISPPSDNNPIPAQFTPIVDTSWQDVPPGPHETFNPPTFPSTKPMISALQLQGPIDDCMRSVTLFVGVSGGFPFFNHIINVEIDTFINRKITNTQNLSWDFLAAGGEGFFEIILGKCLKVGDLVQIVIKSTQIQQNVATNTITVESHDKYSVTTQQYNNARTGWYPYETQLTVARLKLTGANAFKQQFTMPVDQFTDPNGKKSNPKIYAQPLYLHHVNYPAPIGVRNTVFIAAENNMVYAFDADNPGPVIWKRSLLPSGHSTPATGPGFAIPCTDIMPCVGISSTPVISCDCDCDCDNSSNHSPIIYVTSKTVDGSGNYHWFLHALEILGGTDVIIPPGKITPQGVEITAQFAGTGGKSDDVVINKNSSDGKGHLIFSARIQNNRPGLLLLNGVVYVAFASHCDSDHYVGWVIGYDAKTLKQTSVFCTTPDMPIGSDGKPVLGSDGKPISGEGGIWMGGSGLASDGEAIYCTTGNGDFNADKNLRNYGDSVLKLSSILQEVSFFTPADQQKLKDNDADFGSGGVMILPDPQKGNHPNLLVTCGKAGDIFILDRNNLGGFAGTATNEPPLPTDNPNVVSFTLLQKLKPNASPLQGDSSPGIWGGPAYFIGSQGPFIFYGSNGWINLAVGKDNQPVLPAGQIAGPIQAFSLQNGTLIAKGNSLESFPVMGTTPIVSSNQSLPKTGIVWAVMRDSSIDGNIHLRAYDADALCNGNANNPTKAIVDLPIGPWTDTRPFITPTVINGKVYVACENFVGVYY